MVTLNKSNLKTKFQIYTSGFIQIKHFRDTMTRHNKSSLFMKLKLKRVFAIFPADKFY